MTATLAVAATHPVEAAAEAHPDPAERRRALLETAAVMAAFHGYIYFWRPSFGVDLAVVGLLTAAVFAAFARRGEVRSLGYVGEAGAAARLLWPAAVAIPALTVGFRLAFGPLRPEEPFPEIFLALLAYPIWGFLQQLFYVGFLWRGLVRGGVDPATAGLASGVLFGLIHAPNWPLVAATLPFGVLCAWAYRRAPSLLILGILHGIGGACVMKIVGMDLEIGRPYLAPH